MEKVQYLEERLVLVRVKLLVERVHLLQSMPLEDLGSILRIGVSHKYIQGHNLIGVKY
jgi:hypothetical protein